MLDQQNLQILMIFLNTKYILKNDKSKVHKNFPKCILKSKMKFYHGFNKLPIPAILWQTILAKWQSNHF